MGVVLIMSDVVTIKISDDGNGDDDDDGDDGDSDGDDNICSICHIEVNNDLVQKKCQCNAYFHQNCWDKWLEVSSEKRCPCCRIEVVKVDEAGGAGGADNVVRVNNANRPIWSLIVIIWYPLLILLGYLLNGCEDLSNKSFVELLDLSINYLGKGLIFSLIMLFIYLLKNSLLFHRPANNN